MVFSTTGPETGRPLGELSWGREERCPPAHTRPAATKPQSPVCASVRADGVCSKTADRTTAPEPDMTLFFSEKQVNVTCARVTWQQSPATEGAPLKGQHKSGALK